AREQHALAGDAAVDEGDLPVYVRDPDSLVVDGLDDRFVRQRRLRQLSQSVAGDEKTWRVIVFTTCTPFTVYVSFPAFPVEKSSVMVPTSATVGAVQGLALNTGPVVRKRLPVNVPP